MAVAIAALPMPAALHHSVPARLTPFARDVLAVHNAARAAVGAPPLRWDKTLAAHGSDYARQLARMRQLVHSPRQNRGAERENLAQAPAFYAPVQIISLWTSERRHFVPGLFPNVSTTGNWFDVSHYSQMIWPTTTLIGCGMAPGGGYNWLVCRYFPGGNKDGRPVGTPSYRPERGR